MRTGGEARVWLATLLACLAGGVAAPAAQAAFGVSKWEAGTCKESACNAEGKDPSAEFYTQAAGHPDFGITDFAFNYATTTNILSEEVRTPEGHVRDARVDLPPGLAVDPEATPECPEADIEKLECPESAQVGEDVAEGTAELLLGIKKTVTESFPVYNLARKPGEPARFGVEVKSATLALAETVSATKLQSAIYLEGGISWHHEAETAESSGVPSGDYHEFFEIHNIPTQPELVESRLIFWGVPQEHTATGEPPQAFITMPSAQRVCESPSTTYLHVDSYENQNAYLAYADETRLENGTAVVATGCSELAFAPSLSLTAATTGSDQPDGASVDLHIPQPLSQPAEPDSPDVQTAEVSLPEGMTLNAAAARGLEGCGDSQIKLGSDAPIECPAGSEIGTVAVDAPGIPDGSLAGKVYLGSPQPDQGPESGREFRVFLAAEAPRYGVGVRLEGHVKANTQTGRLTAVFENAPQVPFEDFTVTFRGGPRAPLANPLACGVAEPAATIAAYSGQSQPAHTQGFTVDADGHGGACAAPLPMAFTQTTPPQNPATAGAYSPFTLGLARGDAQQYLSKLQTTLPPGLLGAIPSVTLCGEPQANLGTCPASSEIGTVAVSAGAGSEPYPFAGRVYITGPYGGAPYGLSIVVPAVAGPYNFGNVVTRATINVGLYDARLTVTASLPTIVEGVPLRLRTLSVAVNRHNFLFNPTNCSPLSTESLLTGFVPGATALASQPLASAFQVGECNKLAFSPKFKASAGRRVSRVNGASLEVKVTQTAHQADIRAVSTSLPKQLAARITTLRKACAATIFEGGPPPGGCSKEAMVGSATVSTPVLPGTLSGPAYLVSHGGAAYPDLDVILSGDGVTVVLVGHTHIAATGILSSSFETLPDVPISSFALRLPTGAGSLLTDNRNGSLCGSHLTMPITIVAQSGAKLQQNIKIAVNSCPRHRNATHHRCRPLKSHGHGHHRHRRAVRCNRQRRHHHRGHQRHGRGQQR